MCMIFPKTLLFGLRKIAGLKGISVIEPSSKMIGEML